MRQLTQAEKDRQYAKAWKALSPDFKAKLEELYIKMELPEYKRKSSKFLSIDKIKNL